MSLPLREVLDEPTLAAAEPLVLAGQDRLDAPVSWVHTSEVLNIAELLRGGELLLVGGIALATAGEPERRQYLRSLAARGIAGIAVETGGRLPAVPAEMVDEAARLGLPLVELRRVVRFVEVSQAVNGQLVNESVRRLQLADGVAHTLADALVSGADLAGLLDVLATRVTADVELASATGDELGASHPAGAGEPLDQPPLTTPVIAGGVTVAVLTLRPRHGADLLLLDAALDRAPEAIGLALLRTRPPSRHDRALREFLDLAARGDTRSDRFAALARTLRIPDTGGHVAVAAEFGGPVAPAAVDAALRRRGRAVVGQLHRERYLAIVSVPAGAARAALLEDLRTTALPAGVRVAVGPAVVRLDAVAHSVQEAGSTLRIGGPGPVLDAGELGVERLLASLGDQEPVREFIREHVGALIEVDRARGSRLLETFVAFARHGSSKTDTAAVLHLRRQSLYQRLDRIAEALGHPPVGSARLAAAVVAAELEMARRRPGGAPP
jgi:purine catabolism regulator